MPALAFGDSSHRLIRFPDMGDLRIDAGSVCCPRFMIFHCKTVVEVLIHSHQGTADQ